MTIHSTSIVSDIVTDIRDFLQTNCTDLNTSRSSTSWVLTSYPNMKVQYPVIILTEEGGRDAWGAIGTENRIVTVRLGIEVWTDSTKERNIVWDDVYDEMRTHYLDTLVTYGFHDIRMVVGPYNVDQPDINLHRRVGMFEMEFMAAD